MQAGTLVSVRAWRAAMLLVFGVGLASPPTPALTVRAEPDAVDERTVEPAGPAAVYGKLPFSFEANHGQADASVDFLAHGGGSTLLLTRGGAVFGLPHHRPSQESSASANSQANVVQMQVRGADPNAQANGEEQLPGIANYFIGEDPSRWQTGIPTFSRVRYVNVYPGIDLSFYGRGGQLEYDFTVAPGADPTAIRLAFVGQGSLERGDSGDLVMHTPDGDMRQATPVIYQDGPAGREQRDGGHVLEQLNEVRFAIGPYDASRPLVIDPVLTYSTYLGGSLGDASFAIAVDAAGAAYVGGGTESSDFPTTPGVLRRTFSEAEAFVAKLNPSGTGLIYSTFLGGNGFDGGVFGLAVDAAGNAYVAGFRGSDFPTTPGALQQPGGGFFVAKLNPSGSGLLYSARVGATGQSLRMALDSAGMVYLTGWTTASDFPTTPGAFQRVLRGDLDGFALKLNASGSALVYSTLLGSSGGDTIEGMAIDAGGNVYMTGLAGGADFPTTPGAYQATPRDGQSAFVTKLNPTGSGLVYSTILGVGSEQGRALAVDGNGHAFVTGFAAQGAPTTRGAFGPPQGAVFVTKLNPTGSSLIYSARFGSSNNDTPTAIALDSPGNAYIVGVTNSGDFPITPGATTAAGGGFVTKLNVAGSGLVYSLLLGGDGFNTQAYALALDRTGAAYVTGRTSSPDFPTTPGVIQPRCNNCGNGFDTPSDVFVTKVEPGPPACHVAALLPGPPAQLRVAVHADRGLTSVVVTQATNANVSLSPFSPGANDALATATKVNQNASSSLTLRVTDQTGSSTTCDPALVTVGRAPGESPVQMIHHVTQGESHVTIANGTPGVNRVRLLVNGQPFKIADLHDAETRTLDVSSALRNGSDNTVLVLSHGAKGSSAVVMVSDS
jgi:hypothetical protein